jgi:hypothetical protein
LSSPGYSRSRLDDEDVTVRDEQAERHNSRRRQITDFIVVPVVALERHAGYRTW